ncbi:MAG: hypothetical protein WD054_00275 [Gemmatimonadota bacterium]
MAIFSLPTRSAPILALLVVGLAATTPLHAQGRRGGGAASTDTTGQGGAPSLRALIQQTLAESDLRLVTRRFEADLQNLRQRYDFEHSPVRIARERRFYAGWQEQIAAMNISALNVAGRTAHAELLGVIAAGLADLDTQERHVAEWAPLVPFARSIQQLQEKRRDRLDAEAEESARIVHEARVEVQRLLAALDPESQEFRSVTPAIAQRASAHVTSLNETLENWHEYYSGFDPLFTWWVRTPYAELTEALDAYALAIQRKWPADVM